jgi:hypothetical protein
MSEFRRWLRRGSRADRVITFGVGIVAVVALVWGAVPLDTATVDVTASAGPQSGAGSQPDADGSGGTDVTTPSQDAGLGGAAPTTAAGPGGSTAPAGPAAGGTEGSPACDNSATDTGVTKDQVLIGVIIYDLGALNPGLGLDPQADQVRFYNALIDQYNQAGGIQCRRIVAKYYSDPVLDTSSNRQACLQMAQDGVFAVMSNFFGAAEATCPARQGIPNIWTTPAHVPDLRQLNPFIFTTRADFTTLVRSYVFGLHKYGFFTDVGRLGLLMDSCYSDINDAAFANLAQLGYPREAISVYNYGCGGAITTPDAHFAAALQMKRDKVTHLMSVSYGNAGPFAGAAADQGYRPRYGLMDDNGAVLIQAANPPVDPSLDGAIMITADATGAENTPGQAFGQATQDCVAASRAAGSGSPLEPGTTAAPLRGLGCANIQLFKALAERTYPLTRRGLAGSFATLGSVDLSFPAGKNDFRDPEIPAGGQFWRAMRYENGCTCFKLVDGQWHPRFR